MTRSRLRSTLPGMPLRALRSWSLLFCLGCDGGYVLGDARNTTPPTAGQGGEPSDAGGSENAGVSSTAGAGQAGEGGNGSIAATLTLSPTSLPAARLKREYRAQLAAYGGLEPYAYSIETGQLPPGMTLESDGRLHGSPIEDGDFEVRIRATDAESSTVEATFELSVTRVRWLATQTFPSSASTQTLLSLTDLLEPDAETTRIESQSAHGIAFSPDGRWLIYNSFRSLEEVDWYAVDTAAATPSERTFLLTNAYMSGCSWAPDGSKLVCHEPSDGAGELVYFDATGSEMGSAQPLTSANRFHWVDGNTLVAASDSGPYSRMSWDAGVPSEPVPLGVSGLAIVRQSSDGRRAIATADGSDGAQRLLLDLQTGESSPLPESPALTFSDDFAVAVSLEPSEQDPDIATYSFYSVSGLSWSLVGETVATHHVKYAPGRLPLEGHRLVLVKGSQVSVAVIDESGFDELVVPGDFGEVRSVAQSSTGRWLYIETGQRNAFGTLFLPETIEHWLSRVEVEEPARLLAAEFVSGSPAFSPDGQYFRLNGYDSYSDVAVPFYLFDLRDPEQTQDHVLDIPLSWAETNWSSDSSFVTFLGGSPTLTKRILFAVDVLAPAAPPRTIFECSSNPAPLPGCPNIPVLQP